jgi:hypothetical protein
MISAFGQLRLDYASLLGRPWTSPTSDATGCARSLKSAGETRGVMVSTCCGAMAYAIAREASNREHGALPKRTSRTFAMEA